MRLTLEQLALGRGQGVGNRRGGEAEHGEEEGGLHGERGGSRNVGWLENGTGEDDVIRGEDGEMVVNFCLFIPLTSRRQ